MKMKIKKKKSFIIHIRPRRLKIAWFKLLLGAVVILLGASYLEQHKFYLDANTIYIYYNRVKGSWIPERIGDGYPNTARLYRLFFFNQDLSLHTFFVLCSIFYCFVYQWMVSKMKIKNGDWFLIFSTCFIFDCIYMFQPSKEITAMILSILILNQLRKAGRKRYLWAGLLILCYALIFRIYYLFLIVFLALIILYRKNKKSAFIALSCSGIFFCLLYQCGYLEPLIQARVYVEDANTGLVDLFSREVMRQNVLLYCFNYIIMLVRLLFPIEIFIKSPSRAILFVPVYWFLLSHVFCAITYLYKKRKERRTREELLLMECLSFIICHILVSALFEPDFGSYFRHMMGVLPFYYYVVFEASYPMKKFRLF